MWVTAKESTHLERSQHDQAQIQVGVVWKENPMMTIKANEGKGNAAKKRQKWVCHPTKTRNQPWQDCTMVTLNVSSAVS